MQQPPYEVAVCMLLYLKRLNLFFNLANSQTERSLLKIQPALQLSQVNEETL